MTLSPRRRHPFAAIGIGASATYRRKFALGLTAPYGVIAAIVSHDDYRVDVRDGNRFDLRMELGRRFTESLNVGAVLTYDRRHATTNVPIVPGISGATRSSAERQETARVGKRECPPSRGSTSLHAFV